MSILDDAYEFFTGRDPKAADVYADYDRVADVTDRINQIAKNDVDEAKEAIQAAVQELNNVNGFQQYVGSLPTNTFDSTLDTVSTAISEIGKSITSAAEDIKAYEEAPWYEKAGSTILMGLSKVGEGALGVLEDIGDGGLSLIGFAAGGLGFDTTGIENAIEADWSHDAFNFYYESDLAKASAFTEDSAIAGGLELVGNTAGYLAVGGFLSGAGAVAANSTKAGKFVKAAGTFLSSTTRTNTATAFLSGVGSGTESNLKQGMTLNEAVANGGIQQGLVQGGLAYAGGKWSEHAQKSSAVKSAQEQLKTAQQQVDDAANAIKGNPANDMVPDSVLKQNLDDALTARETAQINLNNAKNFNYQGYTDRITKAGQKAGDTFAHAAAHPLATASAAGTTLVTSAGNGLKAAGSGLQKAGDAVTNLPNTVKDLPNKISTAAGNAKTSVTTAAGNAKNSVTQKAGEVFNAAKTSLKEHPIKTVGKVVTSPVTVPLNAAKKVAGAGISVVKNNPAQTVAALNAAGRSLVGSAGDNAAAQFASEVTLDAPETASLEAATGQPIPQDATPQDTTPQDTSNNTSGGGSSPTGGNGNGNSGGNGGGGGSASTQFRIDSSTTPSGNTGGTSGNTTPTVNAPEVETPSTNTPSTETPSTGGTPSTETPDTGTNGDMSGDISTGEEQVPETPSTSTPDAGTPGGVAGNIVNNAGSTGGTSGSTGGNYSGSVVGGFNSQSQNTPIGPEAQLNPEDNIANIAGDNSEIENGTISAVKPGKDNTLDVISIDKNDTTTPNVDTSSAGSAIPAVLGVGAAGAAGVAGIHYIQKKNGKDDEYYEDEEDSSNDTQNSFLGGNYNAQNIDTIGEYDNSQQEPEPEKYRAGTMNELSLDDGADVTIDDNDIIAPQKEELE